MKRILFTALCTLVLLVPSVAAAAEGGPSATTLLAGIGAGWLLSLGAAAYNPRIGAIAAGLMGLGVSLYLGIEHGQTGDMLCTVNDTFNCGTVIRSEYSTVFGIPIAFFGSGFYAAVIAGGAMALSQPLHYRSAHRLLLAGAGVSVLYSVFLAWASTQVGAWCLFCISLYGVNVILLLSALRWGRQPAPEGEAEDRSLATMGGAGALVFLATVVLGGGTGAADGGDVASLSPADLAPLFEATTGELTLDGTEPVLGSSDAPYLIVEFADFECPYCGIVAPELKAIVAAAPDVQVRYKHYPISSLCNENVERPGHTNACGAAMASECANQQQRFWELNRLMFKNQKNLTDDDIRFMAQQIDLDMDAYQQCRDNPLTEASVRADVAHATQAGVTGTPSLYLKGVKGEEWIRVKGGHEELQTLLAAHRAGVAFPDTPPASR
jgi:protein-disulfide isomerase